MTKISSAPRRFDPVGECIYCRSKSPPLSDEHTVANGFGGRCVLPDASCEDCRKITQSFEQTVMRGMLWPMRLHHKMYSRKRGRPSQIDAILPAADGGFSRVKMQPEDVPVAGVLPVFDKLPGLLLGAHPDDHFEVQETVFVGFASPEAVSKATARGEDRAVAFADEDAFARMLAKTAHAHAVGLFGLEGFEAFLPPIILGNERRWRHYIGRAVQGETEDYANQDLWLEIGRRQRDDMLFARFRLFAKLDTPTYMIVIGRQRAAPFGLGMRELQSSPGGSMCAVPFRPVDAIRDLLELGRNGPTPHRVVVQDEAA